MDPWNALDLFLKIALWRSHQFLADHQQRASQIAQHLLLLKRILGKNRLVLYYFPMPGTHQVSDEDMSHASPVEMTHMCGRSGFSCETKLLCCDVDLLWAHCYNQHVNMLTITILAY